MLNLSPEEWTAIGTVATTVILFGTAIFAGSQLLEARRLRREQFRPWVTVDFHFRSNIAFAKIENIGTTVARNIVVRFDPERESTMDRAAIEIPILSRPLPQLAPGESRLILMDRVPDRLQSELPGSHIATVTYEDHLHRPLEPDSFDLNFELLANLVLPDREMDDLVHEVMKIRKSLEDRE